MKIKKRLGNVLSNELFGVGIAVLAKATIGVSSICKNIESRNNAYELGRIVGQYDGTLEEDYDGRVSFNEFFDKNYGNILNFYNNSEKKELYEQARKWFNSQDKNNDGSIDQGDL
mgnify:CR=1 FL=1